MSAKGNRLEQIPTLSAYPGGATDIPRQGAAISAGQGVEYQGEATEFLFPVLIAMARRRNSARSSILILILLTSPTSKERYQHL